MVGEKLSSRAESSSESDITHFGSSSGRSPVPLVVSAVSTTAVVDIESRVDGYMHSRAEIEQRRQIGFLSSHYTCYFIRHNSITLIRRFRQVKHPGYKY